MYEDEGVNVNLSLAPEMLIKVLKKLPCLTNWNEIFNMCWEILLDCDGMFHASASAPVYFGGLE